MLELREGIFGYCTVRPLARAERRAPGWSDDAVEDAKGSSIEMYEETKENSDRDCLDVLSGGGKIGFGSFLADDACCRPRYFEECGVWIGELAMISKFVDSLSLAEYLRAVMVRSESVEVAGEVSCCGRLISDSSVRSTEVLGDDGTTGRIVLLRLPPRFSDCAEANFASNMLSSGNVGLPGVMLPSDCLLKVEDELTKVSPSEKFSENTSENPVEPDSRLAFRHCRGSTRASLEDLALLENDEARPATLTGLDEDRA